jgi:hypothetical protein
LCFRTLNWILCGGYFEDYFGYYYFLMLVGNIGGNFEGGSEATKMEI